MTGVAWYINDMKRKHEHAVRVQVKQKKHLNQHICHFCVVLHHMNMPVLTCRGLQL